MSQCKLHGEYACGKCMLVRKEATTPAMARYSNGGRGSPYECADGQWIKHSDHEAAIGKLRALLVEWEGGMYDGQDFMRRVRLTLHGTGLAVVTPNAEAVRPAVGGSERAKG